MAAKFKPRQIPQALVAAAEHAAATTPTGGDPRSVPEPNQPLASTAQESNLVKGVPVPRYKVGEVVDVPVEEIRSNPVGPRAIYTTAAIDDMAMSLKSKGQNISATGYVDDDNRVVLIEGETRLRGTRAAGLPTLRIEIKPRPKSEQDLYEQARSANVDRKDQSPLDDALKWHDLLGKNIYPSQVALAKALNLGEDHVSRVLKLATLPPRIVQTVADYPDLLTLRMLNALREFWEVKKSEQEVLELILEAADKGWGYRDIEARRKAAVAGPIRRPRATTQSVAYGTATGEIKMFEEGGRLQLELKGLTPDESKALTITIKEILSKAPDTLQK